MGTDGVWDVLSNENVVGIVLASQAQGGVDVCVTTRVPCPTSVLASPQKRKNKISNRMKKISYEPRRNLLEPQTDKNLLRNRSRFCKNIL